MISPAEIALNQRVIDIFNNEGYAAKKAGKTEFCSEFGIDRSNFSKYSNFERVFQLESLVKLSNKYGLTLDWLIKGEEPKFKTGNFLLMDEPESDLYPHPESDHDSYEEVPEVTQIAKAIKKRQKTEIIVATQNLSAASTVPMVNVKAAANYVTGYQSQEYYENLDYMIMPDWMTKGQHTMLLQVRGDSMEPTYHQGGWVQGSFIEKGEWGNISDLEAHIVVSLDHGIQVKRIKNRLRTNGFLRCRSDNRQHAPFNLYHDEILQVWRVTGYYTNYMPNLADDLYLKVDHIQDQQEDLREMYEQMLKDFTQLRNAIVHNK